MRCLRQLLSVTVIWHILVGTLLAEEDTGLTTGFATVVQLPTVPDDELDTISQTSLEESQQTALEPYQTTALEPYQQQSSNIWNLTGGGSFYFLKPFASGNTAFQTTTITTAPVGGVSTAVGQTTNQNFDWNMQPAGAFWLGTANESGLGFQSRFFFLGGNSQNALTSLTPGQASSTVGSTTVTNVINPTPYAPATFPGALPPVVAGSQSFSSPSQLLNAGFGKDNMIFSSSLKINALDLEPTFTWATERSMFQAGSGLRYLQMTQTYGASLQNNTGGGPATEYETMNMNLSNKFYGVGPTLSGKFTRNLGSTGLKLFSSGRGSCLVGNASRLASFSDKLNDPAGLTSGVPNTFVQRFSQIPTSTDMTMTVLELELGMEYGKQLGNNYWYCRGGVVDQTYFNAGNASSTTGNLSLFGFQFSAGVDF